MFYQHKSLHFPGHGYPEYVRKTEIREFRDYLQWLAGNYVPTPHKLNSLTKAGFSFPQGVRTVRGSEEASQEEKFILADHPDFTPGKYVGGQLISIDPVTDTSYPIFKAKINTDQRSQSSFPNVEPLFQMPVINAS